MLIAVTFVMHAVFLGERCIARHLFQIWKNMIFFFFFHFRSLYHIARVLVKPILQPQVCSPHFKGLDFFFFIVFFPPVFQTERAVLRWFTCLSKLKRPGTCIMGLVGAPCVSRRKRVRLKFKLKFLPRLRFLSHVETCQWETFSQVNTGFLEDLAWMRLLMGGAVVEDRSGARRDAAQFSAWASFHFYFFFAPVSNQYFDLFCPGKTCSAALSN